MARTRYDPPPFKALWNDMDAREKKLFCRKTGVSYSHCSQLANGIGRADINTMRKMCNADSRVKPRDLRPDLPV